MDKYDYTIIKRGQNEDGGTWADYTYTRGGEQREAHIKVMPGPDLEETIREKVKDKVDSHEEWEATPPEERERIRRIAANFQRRYSNDGFYMPTANGNRTAPRRAVKG